MHPGLQKHLKHPVKTFDFTSDNSTEDFLNHGTSAFSVFDWNSYDSVDSR